MEQCSVAEVQRLLRRVSAQRAEKAMAYKRLPNQYACLKAYELLHDMLEEQGVISRNEPLVFELSEHGKPHISRYPDVHFNISHCKYGIIVAVDTAPVGVDVERLYLPDDAFLHYTMNEEEIRQIRSAAHPDQAFSLLWTRKEAYVKMKGESIGRDIPQILNGFGRHPYSVTSWVNEEKQYACTVISMQ